MTDFYLIHVDWLITLCIITLIFFLTCVVRFTAGRLLIDKCLFIFFGPVFIVLLAWMITGSIMRSNEIIAEEDVKVNSWTRIDDEGIEQITEDNFYITSMTGKYFPKLKTVQILYRKEVSCGIKFVRPLQYRVNGKVFSKN